MCLCEEVRYLAGILLWLSAKKKNKTNLYSSNSEEMKQKKKVFEEWGGGCDCFILETRSQICKAALFFFNSNPDKKNWVPSPDRISKLCPMKA